MRNDVLGTLRGAVDDALANGKTLEQFTAALEPELKRLGWWGKGMEVDPKTGKFETVQLGSRRRLSIIYDANLRASYAAGHWMRIQRNKRAFPYLRYRQIDRASKREEHKPYDGLVLPVDHPAWRKIFPPNGWRCGCWAEPLTDGDLQRRGYRVDEDFALDEADYTNRRTGETVQVPKGVDPSWSSNPGADFLESRRAYDAIAAPTPARLRSAEHALIDAVRLHGLGDGNEKLTALDLDSGAPLGWSSGVADGVTIPDHLESALRDPARRMALIHNHPGSTSMSAEDIEALAMFPGMASIVAFGTDGSLYRASRGPRLRPGIASAVDTALRGALAAALEERLLSAAEIDIVYSHILNRSLDALGVTRYLSHLDRSTADRVSELGWAIDAIAEAVIEELQ